MDKGSFTEFYKGLGVRVEGSFNRFYKGFHNGPMMQEP